MFESSVERAISNDTAGSARARLGGLPIADLGGDASIARSVAVTENEVRKQTQESIFNAVRSALRENGLLREMPATWRDGNWQVGEFVEFTAARTVVPLVSALGRARVIAESFAFMTAELSVESLERRVPQIYQQLRSGADEEDEEEWTFADVIAYIREFGEVARALAGVIQRVEAEAEASGLVDIVMVDDRSDASPVLAVASLDRDYVTTKLLRRLGQGQFGVLGKVLRAPEEGTAFNAFRNSMLGATNQLPVLLSGFSERLAQLPRLLGDSVFVGDENQNVRFDFVGSASALSELSPLMIAPSVEIYPVAIYA